MTNRATKSPRKKRRSHCLLVMSSPLGFLLLLLWVIAPQASEAVSARHTRSLETPPRRFKGDHSSPVLILTGLRDMPTDYVVARIHDRKPASQARSPDDPRVVSVSADLHDLRPKFINANRAPEGVRALAVPDFVVNRTSTLRLAIWFPCDDPPEDVGLVVMPCFYEPLDPSKYGQTHIPSAGRGRRISFFIRHHDPANRSHGQDAAANEDGVVEYVSGLDHDGHPILRPVADHVGDTTRVTCWRPPPRALELDAVPVDLERHSHRLQVTNLYYQSRSRHSGTASFPQAGDAFGNPQQNHDPDVWYGYKVVQHMPVDRDAAAVDGRNYCRSWILVAMNHGDTPGWTTLPPHSRGDTGPVGSGDSSKRHLRGGGI